MLLLKHHQVRHDWVLIPIVTMEAICSCAAVPGGNPHPRRVEKLNWSTEVWNVSSGVSSCLGPLDDITAQVEIEKLKEKTWHAKVITEIMENHCTQPAMRDWSKLNVKVRQNCLQVPPPSTPGSLRDIWKQVLGGFTERRSNPCSCPGITSFTLSP